MAKKERNKHLIGESLRFVYNDDILVCFRAFASTFTNSPVMYELLKTLGIFRCGPRSASGNTVRSVDEIENGVEAVWPRSRALRHVVARLYSEGEKRKKRKKQRE